MNEEKLGVENPECSSRLETKLDELRRHWAGTGYEIVLEKIEMLKGWKESRKDEVRMICWTGS